MPPTTTEAPITIPQSEVQFYELQLVLQKSNRTNETWKKFKDVLASSASTYVTEQNLNYELALYFSSMFVFAENFNLKNLFLVRTMLPLIFSTVRIIGPTTKIVYDYDFL